MIISINDHPEIREVFDGMFRWEIDYQYIVGGSNNPCQVTELIYGNWQQDEHLSGQVHQATLGL